jgi:hypothetical protein
MNGISTKDTLSLGKIQELLRLGRQFAFRYYCTEQTGLPAKILRLPEARLFAQDRRAGDDDHLQQSHLPTFADLPKAEFGSFPLRCGPREELYTIEMRNNNQESTRDKI